VSSKNKVIVVLADIPSNLPILHISTLLSFILPWNKQVDNFIKFVVVLESKFMFDRGAIIIMHAVDLQVLKEFHSFLESYQLKVCMKWIVVNSSP
jgi:hypothetical protein